MKRSRKILGVLTPQETLQLTPEQKARKRAAGWLPAIGGGALESNIFGLWAAKQSGRGAPATMTVGTKKFRWVGGDLQVQRADGNEQFSDGTLFGDTVDFVNTLDGNGAPVCQAQSGALAYQNWLACGQEAVTGGVNATHTINSTATGGTWLWKLNGFVSAPIAWNASAAVIQAAILAATNGAGQTYPAGSVVCAGGPLPTAVTVTFQGALAKQPVPTATVDNTAATGGTVVIAAGVTGTGFQHVATPADIGGFYSTWVKSVGKSVIYRAQFNDARIASLRWEGSSASKVLKVTPTLLILDPGQILTADPTQTDDGTRPFIYTEAAGSFTIDGAVFRGHSSFAIEAQWGLQEWYGDAVTPFDLINTRADVVLQAITILLDQQGLQKYNVLVYGTPTPAANAKPLQTISGLGSYACTFNRVSQYTGGIERSAAYSVPSVKWDPNLAIPTNVAGGPVELPLAGEYRKLAGQPAFQITTTYPEDVAFTI